MAQVQEIQVPDIGDIDEVEVIEVLVAAGDSVDKEDPLITLESDKASMDVPSPASGVVQEIRVSAGDSVKEGTVILVLEEGGSAAGAATVEKPEEQPAPALEEPSAASQVEPEKEKPAEKKPQEAAPEEKAPGEPADEPAGTTTVAPAESLDEGAFEDAYASPSVRKLARELGAALGQIEGTGRKGRITADDVKAWVKGALSGRSSAAGSPRTPARGGVGGFEWPQMPDTDFGKFGEIEIAPMSRIGRVAAKNLHRSWLHVPHVTQHDEADVTEMEAFRKAHSEEAKKKGIKLTPVAFLMKAVASALHAFPKFNSSLHPDGDKLILKKFVHLGVAVDTPDGLVVPVIRDADKKGLFQLAEEVVGASLRAREGKLTLQDFQGATFTISSLGGIGGTAFTPIVNAPEVGILGASRTQTKPVWNGSSFEPRLMLPLSVSYDHRVIDGAYACRFTVHLAGLLSDLRKMLL